MYQTNQLRKSLLYPVQSKVQTGDYMHIHTQNAFISEYT